MSVCPLEKAKINEQPLWQNGPSFHRLGLVLCAVFGLISVIIALLLVIQHATHYLRPYEQKHIIRILMMIPVYAIISFFSYLFYNYTVYWQVIRDCYEAFAIASFFTLLCHYIAPTLREQKEYFRTITPKNWFWGVFGLQKCTGGENKGPFRKPRSGLTWFNIVWVGIFQYCFIRVLCTFIALITELAGRYCETSINPAYGHFWYEVLTAVSVTIAMFCVIQFYLQTRQDLAEHKPFLKVLCIKLVIFFSFWQQLVISFLASQYGPLQPTATMNAPDISVGIPSVLICIEMAFFAVLHIFAFSWKPYSLKHANPVDPMVNATGSGYSGGAPKYVGGPLGVKAYFDAANPWDVVKASARGFRWLFVGYRHRMDDPSYQQAGKAGRAAHDHAGPMFAGTGGPATELRTSEESRRLGRGAGMGGGAPAEDDRTGLLQSPGAFGRMPPAPHQHPQSPYGNNEYAPGDDSQVDLGRAPGLRAPHEEDDTGYHGARSAVHPALREQPLPPPGAHDPSWDVFGGVARPGHADGDVDADSVRPPTYRTHDPGRF